jgi:cell division protein FtsI (penicillin-binding protein 3)
MSRRIKPTRPGPERGRPRQVTQPSVEWLPSRKRGAEDDSAVRIRASVRVAWVGAIIAVGYLLLVGRASSLMLLPDPQLEAKARIQFEEAVEVHGRRGDIVDRNHTLLATTVDLYELHVDPWFLHRVPGAEVARVDDPVQLLADILAEELDLDAAHLAERFRRPGRRDVRVASELTPAKLERIEARVKAAAHDLDPRLRSVLFSDAMPSRFYPGMSDAAPLLGLVGHNGVGRAGLERTLDSTLRGETYKYVLWRDRKGRRITPERIHAEEGNTVVLTIDRRIQDIAERAMLSAVERTGAQAAYAVVMEVGTGEILAMVSLPSQNPNVGESISMDMFKNHAAMDAIEPGSVFKPFVAAAALEEDLYTPSSPVDCEGGAWRVSNKTIHDDHPHGVVTLTEVIKYSSNIGSAKLAFKLGPDRTLSYLKDFGFSRSTGLGLPGETRGAMRTPNNIKPIELATTAYGHGVTATAVQLAGAVATLGNDGMRMQPRLVRAIENRHGEVVEAFPPMEDRRVVSVETARQTVRMMETVTEKGGTGTRARIEGFRVAGKTGTAWKHVNGGYSSTARIGSFVGMVPAEAPRLAIAVVVDTPTIGSSYGGIVAGPAFSEIGEGALRVLGVEPDPELLAEKSNATNKPVEKENEDEDDLLSVTLAPELTWTTDGRLRVPDLTGLSLRDALTTVQGAGLALSIEGSGRVLHQEPAPGTPLAAGERVALRLQ